MSGPQSASTRCGRVSRLLIGVVLLTSWVATAGPARAQNGTEDATQPTPADPESVIEVVATPAPVIVPTPGRPDDPLVHVTQVGETLYTLAARSGFAASELAKRNRLTNPYLLLAGQTIRLPQPLSTNIHLHRVGAGDTLIGLAARYGVTPQHIRRANALTCQTCLVFGQLIRIATAGSAGGLPEPFQFIEVWPSVPQQGQVVTVRISTTLPLESIVGELAGRPLRFAQDQDAYIALGGVPALLSPVCIPSPSRRCQKTDKPARFRVRFRSPPGALAMNGSTSARSSLRCSIRRSTRRNRRR